MYYKIVKVKDGKLLSATNYGTVTEYFLNSYVERASSNGPFAVFNNLMQARAFMTTSLYLIQNNYQIYECKIIKSKEDCVYRQRGGIIPIDQLPMGTILADAVKLTKLIYSTSIH